MEIPILRYPSTSFLASPLDPLEDVASWITGLTSKNYTADLLRRIHCISVASDNKKASDAIRIYARSAVGLLDQAYAASPQLAFLPLYYAILNLSKIYIAAAGKLTDLDVNRHHGATYNPQRKLSHDLLTDQVVLKRQGVFPLFYEVLAGQKGTWKRKTIALRHLVPFLRSVGHEFHHAYQIDPPLQEVSISLEGAGSKFRLQARLIPPIRASAIRLRYLKLLVNFRSGSAQNLLHSPYIAAPNETLAAEALANRYLRLALCGDEVIDPNGVVSGCITPLSASRILMIEEVPIWLTFFALANVVRYNPEFLERLQDSKAWPLLLTMRKHVMLRFLLLCWSFLHKTVFHISRS